MSNRPEPPEATALCRVSLSVPEDRSAAFEAALSQAASSLARFEEAPGGLWRIEALVPDGADIAALRARLLVVAATEGVEPPEVTIGPLPETDWVAATRASFPPIDAGRYHVRGSHLPPAGPGTIDLMLDAGPAFGTGEHESTRGCLLALDGLADSLKVGRALDMGCGSGILAMATAKTWKARVVAADVDPAAVETARQNAQRNGVGHLVESIESDGYRNVVIGDCAPFDLITANLLARPLIAMAPDLARALSAGGRAVLSGLLARQADGVLAAHHAQGLTLVRRVECGDWHTLVVGRNDAG